VVLLHYFFDLRYEIILESRELLSQHVDELVLCFVLLLHFGQVCLKLGYLSSHLTVSAFFALHFLNPFDQV